MGSYSCQTNFFGVFLCFQVPFAVGLYFFLKLNETPRNDTSQAGSGALAHHLQRLPTAKPHSLQKTYCHYGAQKWPFGPKKKSL